MKQNFLLSCFALLSISVFAQNYDRAYDIPVNVNGNALENPWAGGLNSCQVSRFDANMDGKKDLFIFDRVGSKISIYLNMDDTPGTIQYKYTLDYNSAFPFGMRNWVFLRDMNCDGKEDICNNSGSSFRIFWNTSTATELSFNQTATPNLQALYDFGDPFTSTVYCIAPDLPAFNDYDNDGDIDIWSWNEYSSSEYFYKNMAVENGDCSVPVFECRNRCYGMFGEASDSFQLFMGEDFECDFNVIDPRSAEGSFRHTGGTTLAVDLDQNGLRDLIIGDVTENSLAAITMVETSSGQDSASAVYYDFPATFNNTIGALMTTFLGAFYEDINNDGIHDLLVSPNAIGDAADIHSLMLYINTGVNDLPVFEFVQDNFLQEGMIDLGVNAYPVVFDVDNDGLKDLLVSNRKYFDLSTPLTNKIWYYRNTGSLSAPAFELVDSNWLNIPSHGWLTVYPAFGDLDGDGDSDMVLGDQDGVLHHFTNTAAIGQPANFVLTTEVMQDNNGDLDVGQNSTPQIIDLNGDGKNDIVIGELNGSINYYENIGTTANYSFQFVEDTIGSVVATSLLGIQGKSVPHFFKNASGLWELLVGTETGQINHYNNIEGNIFSSFNLVTSSFENIYEGERSSVYLADITGDDQLDMFVGNIGGGVGVYAHFPVGVDEQYYASAINIYPNPSQDHAWIELPKEISTAVNLDVYDGMGRIIKTDRIIGGRSMLNTSDLPNGLYILKFTSGQLVKSERLLIRK